MLQRSTADTLLLGWSQHREDLLKAHCPFVLVFWKWQHHLWTKAFQNTHVFLNVFFFFYFLTLPIIPTSAVSIHTDRCMGNKGRCQTDANRASWWLIVLQAGSGISSIRLCCCIPSDPAWLYLVCASIQAFENPLKSNACNQRDWWI